MRSTLLPAALAVVLCPLFASAGYHLDTLSGNRWRLPVTNWGSFGAGASWRVPAHRYLFGCGPWVGATVGRDTLTTVGYNPNSGGSEMCPGDSLGGYLDPAVMVYVSNKRWPPPRSRFPGAPQSRLSDQDIWTLYNDFDPEAHVPPGRPLQLQVVLAGYAWRMWWVRDIVFLQFALANQSSTTWHRAHFGIALDCDIGNPAADIFGLLRREWVRDLGSDSIYLDHLAYCYDRDHQEPGWDLVGAVGFLLLRSPGPERLTAAKRLTIEFDPVTDQQRYLALAGYDYRTGDYCPFDSSAFEPGDQRFLISSGPFDLAPGAVDTAVIAIVASALLPREYELARLARAAELLYSGLEEAPESPNPGWFSAQPNPFRDQVRFSVGGPAARQVDVFDTSGRLVAAAGLEQGQVRWQPGPSLGPGIYIARCGHLRLKLVKTGRAR